MAAASSVVIKVKYEDTLMRFGAQIINGDELSLTADELRKKILSLFEFSSDTEIMLTYVDEDGDTVTIVDSVDLSDVVNQCLNPIRFTVEPVSENDSRKFNPSGSFSRPRENDDARKFDPHQSFDPNTLPQLVKNLIADDIPKFMESLPEPMIETLGRVVGDLISKYGTVIADHLLKVSESDSKRAKVEKHYSCGSFNPLNLPPTREKDARRENSLSVSVDPLTFLSHEHQHHRRFFENSKEFVMKILPDSMIENFARETCSSPDFIEFTDYVSKTMFSGGVEEKGEEKE